MTMSEAQVEVYNFRPSHNYRVPSNNMHRHSLAQFVQMPWSFCKFQACDPTIQLWWLKTVCHRFTSTQTPCDGDCHKAHTTHDAMR